MGQGGSLNQHDKKAKTATDENSKTFATQPPRSKMTTAHKTTSGGVKKPHRYKPEQ